MAQAGEDVGRGAGWGGLPLSGRPPQHTRNRTGREEASRWLDRLLLPADACAAPESAASERATVCVLTGPPGPAAPALVLHWAEQARGRFCDGHLYADLRGSGPDGPGRPADVLDGFLRALGVAESGLPGDPAGKELLYRSLLDDRSMLIVLADAASDAQVRPLLPPAGDCAVVVTGRVGLAIKGAYHLAMDATDATDSTAEATQDPSAGRASAGDAFAHAYQALPLLGRRFLRLLSLHPGPEMSLAAAAALTGQGSAQARPLMDALVEAGLVEALAANPQRFRLHELYHAFARDRAGFEENAEDIRLARRRVLQWYLHGSYLAARYLELDCYRALELSFITARHEPPAVPDRRAAQEWFDREWMNLLCAVGSASEHGFPDVLWQLSATLRFTYLRQDRAEATLAVQRIALASARHQRNRHAEAVALDSLTLALVHAGAVHEAEEHNLLSIALWHLQGERAREAVARLIQVRILMGRRDWPHAVPLGWTVVDTAEQLGDRRLEAAALGLLAECYAETRRFEEAQLLLHEVVALHRADPWASGLSDALWNTSRVLRAVGRPAAALGPARDALVQAEATADGSRQARGLLELALVWQANGHDEKALATFQRATARARLCADRAGQARALGAVAGYHRGHGDLSAAHAFAERAVALSREVGDRWWLAVSLEQSAQTLDLLDQSAAATRHRQEAYTLFEEFDEPRAHEARRGLSAAVHPDPWPTLEQKQRDERNDRKRTVRDGGA
ncbi:hypothetical protein KDL01_35095 [Actinospica durhamensis]|uniref:Tetratricopeptide repeat protein n=1 Tax=Actinospica durhamensis TaxID=1508375 RepID=A0A941EUU3_9ACTN|nr:hypothetical protein [Actinospica durhamensis]MBR7838547.1 hypothetical protein [Actinospica durhamensis]